MGDEEEDDRQKKDEERRKFDPPLIRLKEDRSQLDLDDLDEEERRVLAEVSKKGYYHNRPKTIEAPSPQKIENPTPADTSRNVKKRSTFDKYQEKWDKFDKQEPEVQEVEPSKPKKAAAAKAKAKDEPSLWDWLCCRKRRSA
mmetsp:Transcript_40747/g.61589  ORF Transcript_40747/g.61589 Transcript_40747/m.61589 type:complete len:142 (+) Transcript_40747:102-527(+)